MTRVNFNQLPVEGPKFPRDTSRVVNQLMNGKSNNVVERSYTGAEIVNAGFRLRVEDVRVSEQSCILFQPISVNAFLLPALIIEQGKGYFIVGISDPADPYGYAQGQTLNEVPFTQAVVANVWEEVTSPNFTTFGGQLNTTHNNGVLTVEEGGTCFVSAICSLGATPFPNNSTITFGAMVNNDQARALGANWTRRSNAGGVPLSFAGYVQLAEGDTIAPAVELSGAGTIEFDSVMLSIYTVGVSIPPPLIADDLFSYRYLVVG